MLALLGGPGGSVTAQDESEPEPEPMAFPTGSFVSVENPDMLLEFQEDGTGVSHNLSPAWYHHTTYAVDGDVYTWLSADWDWEPHGQVTYAWDYDGERLTFEPMSEDPERWRRWVYTANTYVPVEDPRIVMVAATDIGVGEPVYARRAFVASAVAGPDAFTRLHELIGPPVAAVPISEGQPITPDMLEAVE
jgi:hypothetical protein